MEINSKENKVTLGCSSDYNIARIKRLSIKVEINCFFLLKLLVMNFPITFEPLKMGKCV